MKQQKKTTGFLITIEGIDGSGKSTVTNHLFNALKADNIAVIQTREPGDTPLGYHIRSLLHNATIPKNSIAEYLLFAADRAQHISDVIMPALSQGSIVISDRYADSSVAYQGYGRGINLDMINRIHNWIMPTGKPDLTIYLQVAPKIAMNRIKMRGTETTPFEQEHISFMKRVVTGFDTIFSHRKDSVIFVNGEQPIDTVTSTTINMVRQWLKSKKR